MKNAPLILPLHPAAFIILRSSSFVLHPSFFILPFQCRLPYNASMHAGAMDIRSLVSRARGLGATPAAARELAKAVVARFAGRATEARPSRRMLDEALATLDFSLPTAEAVPAADGTVRFAVRLSDGALVETVSIEHPARSTVCLSCQVGCARGCAFCETGRLGLQRNLLPEEITAQYAIVARRRAAEGLPSPTNVVFMGMGEPLDNLDAVLAAASVLSEDCGFAVAQRRITVSTVGIVPKIHELRARSRLRLAVSLHAANDADRRRLVPAAQAWDLASLHEALAMVRDPVLLQWTLIDGMNDADRHADELLAFAGGLDARVNLIPLNTAAGSPSRAPPMERVRAFQRRIADGGVRCLVRMPHGQEVGGACGQLAGALRHAPDGAGAATRGRSRQPVSSGSG